ncbi:MAG TPA: ABC transporter ATP-binding protein [Planctomycetota bacterium]
MATPLFELRGVEKSFARRDTGREGPILAGVDLVLAEGERVVIVGPSGSGKSTLLAILAGLEPPSAGRVLWQGRDLAALDERARAELRAHTLGFLFQAHHLLPQLSALENALVPTLARAARAEPDAAEARARELLARVGLGARLAHRPAELSGGERARVALVRALINRPRCLLADEPTGALDARTAEELGTLLLELNASEGVALVVVTHAERLAARLGRVLALEEGRLVPR